MVPFRLAASSWMMLLNLLRLLNLLLQRQVCNWYSIASLIVFIWRLVPDIFISFKVALLLFGPLITFISFCLQLLLLFMMHNCPPFLVIENIDCVLLVLLIFIFILQPLPPPPPPGMGSSFNIICGIINWGLTGKKEDDCVCERVGVDGASFASLRVSDEDTVHVRVQARGCATVGGFTTIGGVGGIGCK
jgi:hypothetical protein